MAARRLGLGLGLGISLDIVPWVLRRRRLRRGRRPALISIRLVVAIARLRRARACRARLGSHRRNGARSRLCSGARRAHRRSKAEPGCILARNPRVDVLDVKLIVFIMFVVNVMLIMFVVDVMLIMFVVDVMLIVFIVFVSVVALRMRARWCRVRVGWRCHPYSDTFSIELRARSGGRRGREVSMRKENAVQSVWGGGRRPS